MGRIRMWAIWCFTKIVGSKREYSIKYNGYTQPVVLTFPEALHEAYRLDCAVQILLPDGRTAFNVPEKSKRR